ncbi:MAG: LysR family transcriptional regulator, partial [Oscillospiraceae bacterium]|nr:LysR family transcriptional regulator [Oscillospiraceae bacterium]
SFTKAANSLYISQPAISKSISKLEEELGVRLFERVNGTMSVTEAGKLFYSFVVHQEAAFREMLEEMRGLEVRKDTLRIGCPETWNSAMFMTEIEKTCDEAGIAPAVEPYRLSELLMHLNNGTLDVVISHNFYSPSLPGLSSREIAETGCGILYSREHFADFTDMRDFSSAQFLLFDEDIEKRFASVIGSVCALYGFTPRIANRMKLQNALFEVSRGHGVMFFSDWDSEVSNAAFGYFRLPERLKINALFYEDRLGRTALEVINALGNAWTDSARAVKKFDNTL